MLHAYACAHDSHVCAHTDLVTACLTLYLLIACLPQTYLLTEDYVGLLYLILQLIRIQLLHTVVHRNFRLHADHHMSTNFSIMLQL